MKMPSNIRRLVQKEPALLTGELLVLGDRATGEPWYLLGPDARLPPCVYGRMYVQGNNIATDPNSPQGRN